MIREPQWLTLPALGSWGRLGNQLWQLAMGIAHAREHGAELRLPLWEYTAAFPGLGESGATYHRELFARGLYSEPSWNFRQPVPFWNGMGLHGYWQAPRYWGEHREMVRTALLPVARQEIPSDLIVVHVRRGDYLALQDHHRVTEDSWIERAVALCREAGGGPVRIVTDDPIWCARHWTDWDVSTRSETWDLDLLTRSRYVVGAASSFSWWGAFLGGGASRTLVFPSQWFGPALAGHDVRQLDPDEGWVWLE